MQARLLQSFSGHQQCIYALEQQHSLFYTGGGDGYVVEWDFEKGDMGNVIAQTQNPIYALHLDKNRQLLYIGTAYGNLHIVDLKTHAEVHHISLDNKGIYHIAEVEDHIYIASGNGLLYILSASDYKVVQRISLSNKSLRGIDRVGHCMAIGTSEGTVKVFDTGSIELLSTISVLSNTVFAVKWIQEGKQILMGGRDARLLLYDIDSKEVLRNIAAHTLHIHSIQISPNQECIATSSMDKTIKIWSAHNFELLKVLDAPKFGVHLSSVNRVKWWDDHHLLSVSDDKTAALWYIEN